MTNPTHQDEQLTQIIRRLDSIEENFPKPTKFAWAKEIVFPLLTIVILYLGYQLNVDANRRSEAESQRASEHAKVIQNQKYFEFFMMHFADEETQPAAFAMLDFLDPPFRNKLIFSLSSSLDLSEATWQEIVRMNTTLDFAELQSFRVEIYFEEEAISLAKSIDAHLKHAGFQGRVVLAQRGDPFWKNYGGKPRTNEIRFEEGVENRAAKYLARFLRAKHPTANVQLRPTNDPKRPGSLSIWLPYST